MTSLTSTNPLQHDQAEQNVQAARAAQVQLILSRIEALPPLSTVATELLACSSAAQADMAKIIRLIESDPTLSMRVLKLCRGASTGLGDRITTVKRAVLMLGFDVVRSAALSISIYQLMNPGNGGDLDESIISDDQLRDSGGPLHFDRNGFWEHCVATACCAEVIAQRHPKFKVMGAEAFLAGLLHGIGKFVMAFALPKAYGGVIRLARQRNMLSAEIESALLGVNYYVAGKHIGERWGLPAQVVTVASGHGIPIAQQDDGPDSKLTILIIVAKAMARWLHAGWSGDYNPVPNPIPIWNAAGLDPTESNKHKLRNVYAATLAAAAERFEILGMTSTTQTSEETAVSCLARANEEISRREEALAERTLTLQGPKRMLDALAKVCSQPEDVTFRTAAAAVIESACIAMNGGSHALIAADVDNFDPWPCERRGKRISITSPHTLGSGAPAMRYVTSSHADGQQVQCIACGLLDWLTPSAVTALLGEQAAASPATLRLLTLTSNGTHDPVPTQRYLLLSNRDLRTALGAGTPSSPLVSAWWQLLKRATP
jgi:HD-like signal output (HDOD) protein